jgi:hypothetical protein
MSETDGRSPCGSEMGLLDAVLRRERHVFNTALPPDECRRRLGSGFNVFPPQTPIVNPFVVYWTSSHNARLRLTRTGGRFGPAPRIMRVHLIPDGSGTVVEGTTELAPSQLGGGLFMLSVFGLIGYVSTSYYLNHGSNLLEALFPFGYGALFVLFALLAVIVQPSNQPAVLVDNVGGVLEARSVDGVATSNVAPAHAQPLVTAPPFTPPVSPSWPPTAEPRRRMLPREMTLFSPLAFDECVRRIGPDSGDASSRWTGSGGTGLAVVWKSADEVELSKSGLYRTNPRHVVRARLVAQPNGTLIETDDKMATSPKRTFLYFAAVFCGWGLVFFAWGGITSAVNGLLPLVALSVVVFPAQYFLDRRVTANQHAFLIATLQWWLEAVLGTGPDTGVR